jgi:hypothetical protein
LLIFFVGPAIEKRKLEDKNSKTTAITINFEQLRKTDLHSFFLIIIPPII